MEGSIRLEGGSGSHEGRVEIYYLKRWGTVCDRYFNLLDATVVCHQLGYSYASSLEHGAFEGGSGFIWLYNVDCTGYETNLLQCKSRSPEVLPSFCSDHSYDAGVNCSSKNFRYRILLVKCMKSWYQKSLNCKFHCCFNAPC